MNDINKALECIILANKELEAVNILLASHSDKYKRLHNDCRHAKSSLKAIHKINKSNNTDKESAISALSEWQLNG